MLVKTVTFICLVWSGYEDIRERQIYISPVVLWMILGMFVRIENENLTVASIVSGMIPGIISFVLGKLNPSFIGEGDSLLIMCVGLLNGFSFCILFLSVTFSLVFLFSIVMMSIGKLHRKSQVPCVPFMVLGYIGAWLL